MLEALKTNTLFYPIYPRKCDLEVYCDTLNKKKKKKNEKREREEKKKSN